MISTADGVPSEIEGDDASSPPETMAETLADRRVGEQWARRSPLFVLVATAASFGLYVPIWVWGSLRIRPASSILSRHPVPLALFSITPLASCAVLYQLATELDRDRPSSPWSRFGPATATLIVALAFGLTSLADLFAFQGVALAPGMACAQVSMNRIASRDRSEGPWRRRIAPALGVALGMALVLTVAIQLDLPTLRGLIGARLAATERVLDDGGRISIESPGDGWSRVPSGTIGDDDSALELMGPQGTSWITVYDIVPPEPLHSVVEQRSSILASAGRLASKDSETFFWEEERLDLANRSSFEFGDGRIITDSYEILTVELQDRTVEVIAFTSNPPRSRPDLVATLRSLQIEVD